MALQADELYRRAGEHPRIYRSVRLVTGAAAFQPHWSVFENKGASKVAMAFHAARFIGIHETHVTGEVAAVGIVAIHARHGAFGKAVFIRPLEACPDVCMAPGALRVDFRRLARYQAVRSILVDGVAGRATHLIFGMTAIDASDMSGLILMAGEADAIGFGGLQFGGLFDIGCGQRFGVLAARPVAGLAGFGIPAAFLIGFHYLVRVLLKGVEDVLVTPLAGSGTDIFRRLVVRRRSGGSARLFLSTP
jgi:hypothetical protein